MPDSIFPAELAEIIATHRAHFGGFTMQDDPSGGEAPKAPEAGAKPDDKGGESAPGDGSKQDAPLTEGGYKALQEERQARKALEAQVKALEPLKAQMEAIAGVFGKAEGDKTPDVASQIADLQKQVEQMNADKARDALVGDVVKAHPGLSAEDVTFMRTNLASKEAMEAYATRVADAADTMRRRPDRGAGRGGSNGRSSGGVSAGRDLYAETHPTK